MHRMANALRCSRTALKREAVSVALPSVRRQDQALANAGADAPLPLTDETMGARAV